MKKTKIAFEDIKAGDMIEAVAVIHGIKYSGTGVAFEKVRTPQGDYQWQNSQGGTISIEDDEDEIYRIEVAEVKFEDIRKGDRIRVTTVNYAGRVDSVEDTVETLINGMNSFWLNKGHNTVIFEKTYLDEGESRTIEILEREGE